MSNTVDERVVKMQFDNASFEKNVQTSLGTLAKLKDALHFDKVDISGIASNIEKITDKVTGMGGVWDAVLNRVTNKIVDVGQNLANATMLEPLRAGFSEYETQMGAIQTIMANTANAFREAGKTEAEQLKEVNGALDTLNTYADKTIYNFTEMTRNIGTFTAAGVDLHTSVDAIQGIANLAAVSGSTSQQASTAMYQLSQALATGTVKLQDWNSVVNAGMGGQVFQDALTRTAAVMAGSADNVEKWRQENIESFGSFRNSLTEGAWLTTDVLTETLSQFTGNMSAAELKNKGYTDQQIADIQAMAKTAMDAATKVKTFSQLIDTTKEAIGSGWTKTWQIIFGDFEEAKELWTSLSEVINGFVDRTSDARNNLLQDWKDLGGRTKLLEGLANVFKILGNVIQPIKDAITLVFPPLTGKTLADITEKFANFTEKIRMATEFFPMKLFGQEPEFNNKVRDIGLLPNQLQAVSETAEQTTKDFNKLREVAKSVINGDYGNDSARKDALKKAGFDPEEVQAYVDKVHELSNGTWDLSDKTLDAVEKSLGAVEKTSETAEKTVEATDGITESVDKTAEAYDKASANAQRQMNAWYDKTMDITDAGNLLTFSIANGLSGVINIFKSAGKVLGVFGKAWKDSFSGVEITFGHLVAFDEAMRNFADKMMISEKALNNFYSIFKDVFSLLKNVRDNIIKLAISVLPTVLNVISSIISTGGTILRFLASSVGLVTDLIKRSGIIRLTFDALSFVLKEVGSALSFVIKVLGYFGGLLSKAVGYVRASVNHFHIMALAGSKLRDVFNNISETYTKLKNKLAEKLGFKNFDEFTKKADKVVEKIKGFLVPAFNGFMKLLRNLFSGKSISFDIFKGLKGVLSIFDGLFDFAKEKAIGAKFVAFYEVLKSKFGNIADDFRKIFFKKKGVAGFLDKLIPFKKEQTFSEKVMAFYKSVTKNLKEVFESFRTIFFGKQNKLKSKGGIVGAAIPLDKEKESVSKIINFFNKARELIQTAVSNLFKKLTSDNKKSSGILSGLFDFSSIDKSAKTSSKPLESITNIVKKVKDKLANIDLKKAVKNAFSFAKDEFIPNAIRTICDAFGKLEMFVAKLDFKKLLLAAKTARTIVKIFNDIKLAKSFSGMADSIGGFFDNLGGKFGGKEESKATSFLKIAASLALVAKAISLIASIPEDRLDSSVGVVAGIALVLTAITIAFSKINTSKDADLAGATKAALGMAVSLLIISKAIVNIASVPENQLRAAEKIIVVTVVVLTAATFALSKMKTVDKSSALAPIGFALALKMLADTVVKLGTIPEEQIKQGEKNIWKIGLALTAAMLAIGQGNYNFASVLAPLAFAVGVGMIADKMVLLSLIPPMKLIKGGIVIMFIEKLLKSAMQSLEGVDVKVVAAPLAFAGAVYLLARAMIKLGKLDIGTLLKGGFAVTALGVVLVGCMKLLRMATESSNIDKSVLVGLIAVAGSILILGFAVAGLGKLKIGQLFKGGIAVGAIGAVLAGIMYLLSTYTLYVDKSVLASMVVTTGMIVILATTAALIGLVPFWNLLKGVLVIGAVGTILVLATSFLNDVKLNPSAIFGLVIMTISLVVLAETAALIGLVPFGALAKGVGVIVILGVLLTAAAAVLSVAKVSPATLAAPLVMVLAIVLLAMTAVAIGIIPKTILRKGVSVVAILGLLLAVTASELGKAKIEVTDIVALVAVVLGIQMLAMTVLSLGVLPLDVLGKGLGVVAILSLLLTKAVETLGKANFSVVDVAAPLLIVAAVLALAMAVKQLGSLDNGTYRKGLAGIVVLIGGLVVAFKLLASVSGEMIMIGAAFVLFGVGASLLGDAFIKVATGMAIFTQALLMFTALKTEEQFTGLAVGIGVLAGVLFVFIGIIVGFVAALYLMPALIPPLLAFSVALLMIGTGMYLLMAALEKFIGMAGQIGGALAAAIGSIVANAGAILGAIKDAILGAINYIIENAPAFFENAGAMISSAVAGIQEKAPEIKAKVGEAITNAINWIKSHFPAWLEAGKNLLSKVVHGIAENGPKVLAKVGEFLGNALHWIIDHLPEWLEAGKNLLSNVIDGIANLAGDLKDKAGEVVSDAKDAVLDKLDDWISAGKDLIGGLIQGIKDKAGDLVGAAKGVVDDAIQAAKNLLQINSPSKVFRSMGYSIDEGLIVGIRRMAGKVTSASEYVTKGVIKAAKKPLEQLADLMSGDIVDDPTITPVLDLSEIQNGANKLYSMMDEADRLSFSGNVELANEASLSVSRDQQRKRESDNQMMGSLIDAINGLSALIGNTGNVYNVNGVTYDDGSNVSTAVRSLIRAAKIEGRA